MAACWNPSDPIVMLKLACHVASQRTVNSEISQGFYFRETSRMRSFVKIKPSRNGEITLPFPDVGKFCPSRARIFSVANMSFNAIHEIFRINSIQERLFMYKNAVLMVSKKNYPLFVRGLLEKIPHFVINRFSWGANPPFRS